MNSWNVSLKNKFYNLTIFKISENIKIKSYTFTETIKLIKLWIICSPELNGSSKKKKKTWFD